MKNITNYINESVKWERFEPEDKNDEWTQKCLDALKKEYGNTYNVEQSWAGPISFYKKGKKPSLKNLVCMIDGLCDDELAADFGPNKDLEKSLGKKIFDIITSVK